MLALVTKGKFFVMSLILKINIIEILTINVGVNRLSIIFVFFFLFDYLLCLVTQIKDSWQ